VHFHGIMEMHVVLFKLVFSPVAVTKIINESAPRPHFRIRLKVGVAYGSDIEQFKKILTELAAQNKMVKQTPPPMVRLRALAIRRRGRIDSLSSARCTRVLRATTVSGNRIVQPRDGSRVVERNNAMNVTGFVRLSSMLCVGILSVMLQSTCIAGGVQEDVAITGAVWKWQQSLYNNDQQAIPADSSNYTIEFMPDGKLHVRADCNRVGGTYASEGNRLTIELTHSTRAMCPPDSLDAAFKKDLGAAAIYFFKDGFLYLDLKYDTGTMKFSR
jgi:heat shock protein HslJ